MYKVYINDRPVFLTDLNGLQGFQGDFVCYSFSGKEELEFLYNQIELDESEDCAVVVLNKDIDKLIKDFESLFVLINAAGGIVSNNKNEILFIRRNDRWDLPKGKVEEMEEFSECAVREVQEECGIN
ncbi:MAG: NUDIX domain-containing protein, partial [Bacteroidetes bacterium]|nr:NUDIX domain-containing protein [Bacteroidota bacterium]